jgi:uncharacterized spore protein YtfJ
LHNDNINDNFDKIFQKLDTFINTKTVVGDAIHIDDIIIVPLIEASFGLGIGLSSHDKSEKHPNKDIGGSGMGAKLSPAALLVIQDDNVQLVNVKNQDSLNKLIDMVPGIISKLNLFKEKTKEDQEENSK